MTMQYIRDYYQVPARRGMSIEFRGEPYVIIGSRNQYLRARPVGEPFAPTVTLHPTWEIQYPEARP